MPSFALRVEPAGRCRLSLGPGEACADVAFVMTSDLEAHTKHIQHYVDMGFDEVHLHNVGRNQAEFVEVFGQEVLPELRLG